MFADRADDQFSDAFANSLWVSSGEQPAILSVAARPVAHAHKPVGAVGNRREVAKAISCRLLAPTHRIDPVTVLSIFVQLGPCEGLRREAKAPLLGQPKGLRCVRAG